MLASIITVFSIALILLFWRRIVVPLDRMTQMAHDLDDPGYLKHHAYEDATGMQSVLDHISNQPAAVSAGSFV